MDSRRAFYSSELHTISYYQCYKQSGFDKIAVELYYENGVINTEDVQNYENAFNAGLGVELVLSPNRCQPVDRELEFLKDNINFGGFGELWAILSPKQRECDWLQYTFE